MAYIDTYKKGKVNGTADDDEINVSGYIIRDRYGEEKPDTNKKFKGLTVNAKDGNDFITATKYIDIINCGNGNDTVYSTLGNDKITGGKGDNRIEYSGIFDNDTVILTKGENLVIDLKSYGLTDINDLNCKINGKDLVITVSEYGSITLKNFAKTNVVGSNGSVKIKFDNNNYFDLNNNEYLSYTEKDLNKKGAFTGSRFKETIDVSKAEHNVTISGKNGYNTIIGTNGYTDKITGGNDGNEITTGSGNKTVTTGSGDDTITLEGAGTHKINAGNGTNTITVNNGNNTIKCGNGNDFIRLNGISATTVSAGAGENNIYIDNSNGFGGIIINEEKVSAKNNIIFSTDFTDDYVFSKSGKNLIITDNKSLSTLTIKDYYSTTKKHAENNFIVNGSNLTLDELISKSGGFIINGSKTIHGTDNNDYIIANDYTSKKASNDTIYAGKGKDTINAGKGLNSICFKKGDGEKTIVNGGGDDILVFDYGTELKFSSDDDDLFINYGNVDDIITINNFTNSFSAKYIQIGEERKYIEDSVYFLSRGSAWKRIDSITDGKTLILTDTFDGKNYEYFIKSLNGTQTAKFEYLANGRLVIDGNYIEVTALNGQKDDIILLGNNNKINTADDDDIVRVGYAIDGNGEYHIKYDEQDKPEGSNYNTINTGDGNDYVMYYGHTNKIDTGDGTDKTGIVAQSQTPETEDITNCEQVRNITLNTEYDNSIGWFNQGGANGDCRLFVLLDSLSRSSDNFNLNDYVDIVKENDNYTVTFKKYTEENNSVTISKANLNGFGNVTGDLDTVLIDYALNQLCNANKTTDKQLLETYAEEKWPGEQFEIYELNTVQKAYYNTLSNYIFGTEDITIINHLDNDFKTKLAELYNAYQNNEISNISVGIQALSSDFKLGILTGHAYTLKELTESTITLINPWDSADHLTLDLNKFYRLYPCVVVYGTDYYNDALIQDNGFIEYANPMVDNFYIADINNDVACWTDNTCGITAVESESDLVSVTTLVSTPDLIDNSNLY